MHNPFTAILHWLRAGYPDGVPQSDYVALLGILRRSLTDEEVEEVVVELQTSTKDVGEDDVRRAIRRHLLAEPSEDDMRRVLDRLGPSPLDPGQPGAGEAVAQG